MELINKKTKKVEHMTLTQGAAAIKAKTHEPIKVTKKK